LRLNGKLAKLFIMMFILCLLFQSCRGTVGNWDTLIADISIEVCCALIANTAVLPVLTAAYAIVSSASCLAVRIT